MEHINDVRIVGRLTADPELKQTANGKSTLKIYVAVPQKKYSKDAERKTDFIAVQAWNKTAEFISKWFSKGSAITVKGELRSGSYNDKKYPEVRHYETYILADDVDFVGDKPSSDTPAARGETASPAESGAGIYLPEEFEDITGADDIY